MAAAGHPLPLLRVHPATAPTQCIPVHPCVPPLQLHLPGMSTSASFDDLLQSLMMAEGSMSTSL